MSESKPSIPDPETVRRMASDAHVRLVESHDARRCHQILQQMATATKDMNVADYGVVAAELIAVMLNQVPSDEHKVVALGVLVHAEWLVKRRRQEEAKAEATPT